MAPPLIFPYFNPISVPFSRSLCTPSPHIRMRQSAACNKKISIISFPINLEMVPLIKKTSVFGKKDLLTPNSRFFLFHFFFLFLNTIADQVQIKKKKKLIKTSKIATLNVHLRPQGSMLHVLNCMFRLGLKF